MKERLIWADALKGILILLVVVGHVIQMSDKSYDSNHLWNMIYSFHMPAFMAVSGWLTFRQKANDTICLGKFMSKRFRQLLIPYFVWSFLWWLTDNTKQIYDIVLVPDRYFWFLWALFFISLAFISSQKIAAAFKYREDFFILAAGILLVLIMIVFDFRLFGFQFISYYYLFYLFGYAAHKYELTRYGSKIVTAGGGTFMDNTIVELEHAYTAFVV